MRITSTKCKLYKKFASSWLSYNSERCPRIYTVNGSDYNVLTSDGNYTDNTDNDNNQIVGTRYTNSGTEDYMDISFLNYKSGNSITQYRVVGPGGFLTFEKNLGTYYCSGSYLQDSQSQSSNNRDYYVYWDDTTLRIGDNVYSKSQFKDQVIPTRLFCFLQAGGGGGGGCYAGWNSEGAGGGGSGGWVLAILKRPTGAMLAGNLRVGCGGEGGSPGYSGAKGSDSWIELHNYYDEEEREYATAEGGYGGRTSYSGDNVKTGAGGSGGSYTISTYNGNFIEKYSAGSGVSGLPGGQACKGRTGAYHSQYVSPITFAVHDTNKTFGSSHSSGYTYYNDTDNDGGGGGDSMFSAGGPGCTDRLRYAGGYEYSYVPNCTMSSGYVTESNWAEHKHWMYRSISTPGAGAGGGGASPDMQYDINRYGGDGGDGIAMFFC